MSIQKLIRRSGVTLKAAIEDSGGSGNPDTPVSIGRPKDQIRITDSRGVQTITDFSTAASAINEQITDGRTVEVTFSTNLVTDDAGYVLLETAYDADALVWLQITTTAIDGTTTKTWGYVGFVRQLNVTLNESGVSTTDIAIACSEVYDWS